MLGLGSERFPVGVTGYTLPDSSLSHALSTVDP